MQTTVNLWPLLGVLVIVVGFVLRFNPLLVVALAAVATGIAAQFSPEALLAAIGTGFIKARALPLIILLPLAVIGLLERHGLRLHAQNWIARFRNATVGRLLIFYLFVRETTAALGLTSLGGHPQMVRPLLAPMAEGTAEKLHGRLPEALRQRLYTRRDALAAGELPVPLKLVQINRCPILAPFSVLRPEDQERLQFDTAAVWRTVRQILDRSEVWRPKLPLVYDASAIQTETLDAELRLYDGFIDAAERQLCDQLRQCPPAELGERTWSFRDNRHPELFFRYRARNFPALLTAQEATLWRQFCRQRLLTGEAEGQLTCGQFLALTEEFRRQASVDQLAVLDAWSDHVRRLVARLDESIDDAT